MRGKVEGRGFWRRLIIKQGSNRCQLVMPEHWFLGWAGNVTVAAIVAEVLFSFS